VVGSNEDKLGLKTKVCCIFFRSAGGFIADYRRRPRVQFRGREELNGTAMQLPVCVFFSPSTDAISMNKQSR
jgi:hypothetical protein